MRIAVLSDIHGNLPALEAVLADLSPFDAVWQLGDVVGYGPQPDEVVARLIDEHATGVRGNHDSASLGILPVDAFNDDARTAIEWTAEHIAPATRRWLAELPLRGEEVPFTLVHASPCDPNWEYIYSSGIARANLDCFSTTYCLVGHTHVPLVFRQGREGRLAAVRPDAGTRLTLGEERLIINPGSVGQPRDGDPRASAVLLDMDEQTVEWRRIAYPIEKVQELMAEASLPARLIARLQFGL
jgi:predicted phosphodiesterase